MKSKLSSIFLIAVIFAVATVFTGCPSSRHSTTTKYDSTSGNPPAHSLSDSSSGNPPK
jgi:hypothetical protein